MVAVRRVFACLYIFAVATESRRQRLAPRPALLARPPVRPGGSFSRRLGNFAGLSGQLTADPLTRNAWGDFALGAAKAALGEGQDVGDPRKAELKLMELQTEASPSNMGGGFEPEAVPHIDFSHVEASVSALLKFLEVASPPPPGLSMKMLAGEWQLEFTDELPASVLRECTTTDVETTGLAVVLSISDSGEMTTTARISLPGGERKVVTLNNEMVQLEQTSRFSVQDGEGDYSSLDVRYVSDSALILRREVEDDTIIGQVLEVARSGRPARTGRTEVWQRVGPGLPVPERAALWRFGLHRRHVAPRRRSPAFVALGFDGTDGRGRTKAAQEAEGAGTAGGLQLPFGSFFCLLLAALAAAVGSCAGRVRPGIEEKKEKAQKASLAPKGVGEGWYALPTPAAARLAGATTAARWARHGLGVAARGVPAQVTVPPTDSDSDAANEGHAGEKADGDKQRGKKKPSYRDGLAAGGRFLGALGETFVDVATAKKSTDTQKRFEYRKGIEGMSMGTLAYEMMTTDSDSKEYDELQKNYQSGWGLPFISTSAIMDGLRSGARFLGLDAALLLVVNILETAGFNGTLFDGIPVKNKWMNILASNVTSFGGSKANDQKLQALVKNALTGNMERVAGAPMPIFLEGYGDDAGIYKIVIGPRSVVVVSDPVIVKHIFQGNQKNYTKGILSEVLEPIMGKGLIPADPVVWKERRRAIAPGFRKKWLESMTGKMVACADNLVDELVRSIGPTAAMTNVNMEEKFTSVSLDIIGKTIFNYDFSSVERESPILGAVYSVLREAERRAQAVIPYWNLPGATKVFRDQQVHDENLRLLNTVLDELIRTVVKSCDEMDKSSPLASDISLLMYLVMTKEEDVTTRQLRDDLMTLLIAGHETTAALLTWSLHELMKPENEDIMKEVRQEIDSVLGSRAYEAGDFGKLPLLKWVLLETLRLYPQPPLLIRRCEKSEEVPTGPTCQGVGDKVTLLAGQDVFISTWSLHRSRALWGEDGSQFNPRRWADKVDGKGKWAGYDPSGGQAYPNERATDFAFLPFGGGARKCVGDYFALLEAEVVMVSLLQRFNFEQSNSSEVGMTTGATIHTTSGLFANVSPRSPNYVQKVFQALRPSTSLKASEIEQRMEKKAATSVAQRVEPEALVVPSARELRMLFREQAKNVTGVELPNSTEIDEAYEKCRDVTREYSKTFYLGSQFLDTDEQKVVWAIYNWCRSTDELVDGPAAANTTMADLEAWDQKLNQIFNVRESLQSSDWEDLAMADGVRRFALIQRPFQDMIGGMAMDLTKERYETFQELEVYCYRVAGTVGIMTLPVLGFDGLQNFTDEAEEKTIYAACCLGLAFQLTNILRDVGEDARRNRIYVPLEDLSRFGITEEEVMESSTSPDPKLSSDPRWKDFMEFQFERCEKYYVEAESGIVGLSEVNRLGVMAALFVYRGIIDRVRENNYDNFSRRAYVDWTDKMLLVGQSWWRCEKLKEEAEENVRSGSIFQRNGAAANR